MSSSPDDIKIHVNGPVMTVTPTGDLDLVTAPALARVLEDAADAQVREVRIVMSDVTFMDSTGLNALLQGWQAAQARGLSFAVVGASPNVRRVLTITGMTHLLDNRQD